MWRVLLPLLLAGCGPDDVEPRGASPEAPPPTVFSWPGCVTVTVDPGELDLQQHLAVDLEAAGPVWATCTAPEAPEELHLVESPEAATRHDLALYGLLGDTRYTCELHAGCEEGPLPLELDVPAPAGVPALSATSSGSGPTGAYTLFNSQKGCFQYDTAWVLVVDPEGRLRWAYPAGRELIVDLDTTLVDPHTVHVGGGWAFFDEDQPNRGLFRTLDLAGEVLIERTLPDFGLGFNHHSEPLPDGSYLSLTGSTNTLGARSWHGVGVELWHPDEGLLWTWDSQQLVDAGVLEEPALGDNAPYHANSVELRTDALGEAAWLSLYGARAIWRIDRATGERTHVLGVGGDFVLRDLDGSLLGDEQWPWVQHDPDYDGDRILLYDNGQGRPGEKYSRVVEYEVDLEAGEATLLWEWTEPDWFDPVVGDADWLPSGNVLVTRGFSACWTPWSDDTSQLVELVPPDEVVWRLVWEDRGDITFRAQRYDGCDLFANARYCPAVAERIAELEAESP